MIYIKIFIASLVILVLINILFILKIIFDRNKFKKLSKVKDNLQIFESSFFFHKLVEINNLTKKNAKYKKIFLFFDYKYRYLFQEKLFLILEEFKIFLKEKESINEFFVETEKKTNFFKKFNIFCKEVDFFTNQLRTFSEWENFCFEQINEFYLLIEQINEEIEKTKMKINFNFTIINQKKEEIILQIKNLETLIYGNDYYQIWNLFLKTEHKIFLFLEKTITCLKILNLYYFSIVSKQKEFLNLFYEINPQNNRFGDSFLQMQQKCFFNLELSLRELNIDNAKSEILKMINELEVKIFQLKKFKILKKIFINSFETCLNNLQKIKNKFQNFKIFTNVFNENFLKQKFQESGFFDYNKSLQKISKEIDALYIDYYEIKNRYFFLSLINKTEQILKEFVKLWNIFYQLDNFFINEKEKKETIFLTLLNISVMLEKSRNNFLKQKYDKVLQKNITLFVNIFDDSNLHQKRNFNLLFNNLQKSVLDLKINIQYHLLLKYLAQYLFIKVNKKRFINDFYQNKILNCEILFLKQQYGNAIQFLLEIFENEI